MRKDLTEINAETERLHVDAVKLAVKLMYAVRGTPQNIQYVHAFMYVP